MGGLRDAAADAGFVFDAGVTQVVQGVVSGDGDGARYTGSADLWGVLDTGRAGLWSRGLLVAHFEGNWGDTVEGTGDLLPLNGDAIMPKAPSSLALSELYGVQALPYGFTALAGKIDWSAMADTNLFANNERSEFLHEGLINNAVLGAFVPYTALGVSLVKEITPELSVAGVMFSNSNNALSAGFDDLDFDAMTYGGAVTWAPTFGNLSGLYSVICGYSTKDLVDFDIDERYLIGEILGTVPQANKSDNYAFVTGASQYLWVDERVMRSDGRPAGVGLLARLGIGPDDRNLLDEFYSVGVGGFGGPFGRGDDNWGVGWAGTHLSKDFRRDAAVLGADVDRFDHVVEGYYNIALTPAIRTSLHAQYIDSPNPAADEALVLAMRLQLDF